MDKQKVTNHIIDDDLRVKMYRVVDICNFVLKNHEPKTTDFLNPFEIKNAISIINSEIDLMYCVDGGYDDCERSVLTIFPYYHNYIEKNDSKLRFLEIKGNFKFKNVSHRDYLGSLLGLGIKREKIGDLLVHENKCQIVIDSEVCDYILYNFTKVGNNNIEVSKIPRELIEKPIQEYIEKSISVSSLRLDNIISAVFNLSRQESAKYINSELVYVNYEKILQVSKQIEIKSIISVRRHGKFLIKNIGGISKKGKIRVTVDKYA